MRNKNYWVVVVAAVAAFAMSSLYYSPLLLGNAWRSVDPVATHGIKPSAAMAIAELARTFVITFVLARLIALLRVTNWKSVLRFTILLWSGFSAVMWAGAIMWEKTPWQVAAIHSGDWLLKSTLIAVILGTWRPRGRAFAVRRELVSTGLRSQADNIEEGEIYNA
jgi:hypothetical protein